MSETSHSAETDAVIDRLNQKINYLETRLQEIHLHTHVLLEIAKALNASLDTHIIASNIMSAISSLIAVDKASIFLYNEKNKTFDIIGLFDSATLEPSIPDNFDFFYANKSLNEGIPIYPVNTSPEWGWICCLPMQNSQRKIGTINIHSIRQSEITPEQKEFLETIAGHASSALQNALLYAIVEKESITDALTGIYNYRYFQKRLREYISLYQRRKHNTSFGLMVMDIDHFKGFNDKYGHLFGDTVLKTVVQNLSNNLREEDILARYGGEEFILLIPEATKTSVMQISEKARKIIEQKQIINPLTSEKVSVTISIGSTLWIQSDTPAAIITRADNALYEAKKLGRNQCVFKQSIS